MYKNFLLWIIVITTCELLPLCSIFCQFYCLYQVFRLFCITYPAILFHVTVGLPLDLASHVLLTDLPVSILTKCLNDASCISSNLSRADLTSSPDFLFCLFLRISSLPKYFSCKANTIHSQMWELCHFLPSDEWFI